MGLLLLSAAVCASAQTLQQGRNYFSAGNYEKAKPIMLKYLKQSPNDASRNYWYGVCLFETGQPELCLPYLKKAADKKIVRAYRYMAMYFQLMEQYEEAIENYELFLEGSRADKDIFDAAIDARVVQTTDSLKRYFRMLRNTQKICFTDSFVVRKELFLSSYVLGDATGSLQTCREAFQTDMEGDAFIPEMKNSIIYSRLDTDSIFRLYKAYKSGGSNKWIDTETLEIPWAETGNMRYPFMEPDGVTIYFAGTGEESLGGYDIFATRISPATGKFLTPENIGMPFNSPANDYMYAIDEVNNLGWFATDRNQPEGLVCIYVFIPNESRHTFRYEGGDTLAIKRAARLASIEETQDNTAAVMAAKQRLILLKYNTHKPEENQYSFTFVIDDLTDYHEEQDFKSPQALILFQKWTEQQKTFDTDKARLDELRERYASATQAERKTLTQTILELESQVLEQERNIMSMPVEIRNKEIEYIYK